MAITYCVGNPGSGKSYFAAYKIWENFHDFNTTKKTYENKFYNCYTNINQFKFDEFDNVIKFDFEKIKEHLTTLYTMYSNKQTDEELILYCEDNNLFNSYFVLDEIHNIFKNKDDDVLIWWLTYHRHLHHELLLITQDLSLVHNEYKRIAEFFYKAVDSGKRLFSKKFKYIQFSNYRMYQNSIIKGGGISLEFKQEIFNLYHSGNSGSTKSFVRKYVYIALVFLIISFLGFYIFLNSLKTDETPKIKAEVKTEKTAIAETSEVADDDIIEESIQSNTYFYKVKCLYDECSIGSEYENFPISYLNFCLENSFVIFYDLKKSFKYQIESFVIFDYPVFENLKKGISNEENNYDSIPSISIPSIGSGG